MSRHDHQKEAIAYAAGTIGSVALTWMGMPLFAVLIGGVVAPFLTWWIETLISRHEAVE